ncbi:hypothetical protein T4A_5473 [Trichinella pseudospiralis]|uniref:Uncharacterized protein n=1 Tax=Trichinella pseudospiralis TaxID=6337 RepID=A0A0V1FZ67_TRIPS|nr:hypothetical protein T4A_5473 [Trichinella pseudospiralis]KRY91336.1 hypothetical protein T4D_8232 [Trichinella pseudospiralis]KRZ45942.1 hypothetical protein T4C_6955 [Trichinella pseudospiralis]
MHRKQYSDSHKNNGLYFPNKSSSSEFRIPDVLRGWSITTGSGSSDRGLWNGNLIPFHRVSTSTSKRTTLEQPTTSHGGFSKTVLFSHKLLFSVPKDVSQQLSRLADWTLPPF